MSPVVLESRLNHDVIREWSLTISGEGLVNFVGGLPFFGRPFREG